MAAGIPFSGLLTTSASTDTYAVTDPLTGIDGLRSVTTKTVRNAISTERRREGMLVYTQDDKKYWTLNPSPWTGADSDWTVLGVGAGTPAASQEYDFPTPTVDWVMNHTLGGYPSVTTQNTNHLEITGNVSYPSTSQVIVHHDVVGGVAGHATLRSRG